MEIIEIPYRPRLQILLLVLLTTAIGFIAALSALLTHRAGLVLFHLIQLNTLQASYFYGVLTLMALLATLFCLIAIRYSRSSKKILRLDETSVSVPIHTFSDQPVRVQFIHIQTIEVMNLVLPKPPKILRAFSHNPLATLTENQQNRMLIIRHGHKQRLVVVENMLPSAEWFDYFCEKLVEKSSIPVQNQATSLI